MPHPRNGSDGVAQAEPPGDVLERPAAEVAPQRVGVVREVGDEGVDAAVVVVVAERQPHARLFAPFLVHREPGGKPTSSNVPLPVFRYR